MAVITKTIQHGEKSAEVTEIQKAFISLGATIDSGELFTATTAGTYGRTTHAAVTALLARFGFGQPLIFDPLCGRLLHIAVGAEAGSSEVLKNAVRDAFNARQTGLAATPAELVWLARYAVIAMDFTTARKIAAQIPDEPVIKEKVGPIVNLTTLQPPAPERLNPENYLTNRYDYVSRSRINALIGRT